MRPHLEWFTPSRSDRESGLRMPVSLTLARRLSRNNHFGKCYLFFDFCLTSTNQTRLAVLSKSLPSKPIVPGLSRTLEFFLKFAFYVAALNSLLLFVLLFRLAELQIELD